MRTRLSLLSCLIGCALGSSLVYAQENTEEEAKNEVEQIIITGTASGTAERKVDTSFAITNLSADDIERLSPKSTADIFKAIPGVWSESSGGVSGANVFVRGFPGGGDAPFVTVQLQGAPIFSPPTLSFLENSTLFRFDETIAFADGLRGGPNSILSNGQPGLTTNFILKEGGPETEGLLKYTGSNFGQRRVDAVVSGEVAEDLYVLVGGYFNQSEGIRDTGFDSEEGNQFTINVTKEFDAGKFNFFTRVTDDHGVWYLPVPLNVPGVDNSFSQLGTANRQATINFGPDNETLEVDLADGRGWDGSVSGGSLTLDVGNGWTVVDRFSYTEGDANTFGLVPDGGAIQISQLNANGFATTGPVVGAVTGEEFGQDEFVQRYGRWVVLKEIDAITNDLAITKSLDKAELTFGYFTTSFSTNDWWSLGNTAFHIARQGGEILDGIECNADVDGCGFNFDLNATGDGTTDAFYAAIDYKVNDELSFDVGLRQTNHQIDYTADLGIDGTIDVLVESDENELAWTAGVNWQYERNAGVFFRASEGQRLPFFDDYRDNFGAFQNGEDLIQDVTQFELGYKYAQNNLSIYATSFFTEVEGATFIRIPGGPVETFTNESYGLELDFTYYADNGFSITLNSTLQETEITESPVNEGNEAQRQPGWQIRLTPAYDFEWGNGLESTIYATIFAVDDRFGDNENTVVLDGYEQVDIGFNTYLSEQLQLQVSLQNITDEDGLTEGDPRNTSSPNGRFILPFNAQVSLSYTF
ncbi:TonB-dependent receptor [Alteromonadaceae bacterium M269]|nr:TonB-dependent receptor [Alteromonadaceae bacterium M269]